ncbi:hypothetical protein [Flavobacterium poyangense]|uniref:hypothetical protein n=1 Tax=Flavobacterium poyangense TaxID=2204302 RepID=UPI001422D6B3|nr:hypothetical protein [Flavobacterium sp. JXAS1]
MKQLFVAVTLLVAAISFGQNIFPTTGNAGIGTNTPTEKLEVKGNIKISSNNKIYWDWDGSYISRQQVGTGQVLKFVNSNSVDTSNPLGGFDFANNQGLSTLRLTDFRLGVNMLSDIVKPLSILHLRSGNDNFDNGILLHNSALWAKRFSITNTSFGSFPIFSINDVTTTSADIYNTKQISSKSDLMQVARLAIVANGNVGIGSINPDEKLTVKGKIHAEEVRVDLSVPADYVFQKYYTGKSELKSDYVMPTLAEVEKYTKENNHLPNVPSAQEIKDKGLQLGEMSNVLLQKIEELTLYVIEQNKKIEVLEAKLKVK